MATARQDGVALMWFRQDLRLADHPALHAASQGGRRVACVFVRDDNEAGAWAPGGAHRWWLHRSLAALGAEITRAGGHLVLRSGPAETVIPALAREIGATQLHASAAYEPWAIAQEARVAAALQSDGIAAHFHPGRTLVDHDRLRSKSGTPFGVYTPFMRAARAAIPPEETLPAPRLHPAPPIAGDALDAWQLLPRKPDWAGGLRETWHPGEPGAADRLSRLLDGIIDDYHEARDLPGTAGTSRLSPHLHWGEMSPRRLWHAISDARIPAGAREKFLNELLWREFSIHQLRHTPTLPEQPLRAQFRDMPWRHDKHALAAWQRGQTGIPMVDAGMRELWHTGWMHNRVRLITASFLVKHLLIHWRDGEAWFWDTLVDGDLASNAANWQWVAGCGADAAPFFRIFNPALQGRKFDESGGYVRRWCPELAGLPDRYVHMPWEAPPLERQAAGVTLGKTYPEPIISLQEGRDRALAAFRHLTGKAA